MAFGPRGVGVLPTVVTLGFPVFEQIGGPAYFFCAACPQLVAVHHLMVPAAL
jgi:hypothetical protein